MKKGLIPVALGTIVTATGLALDSKQSKKYRCQRNDYTSMVGTLLIGVGAAHVLLGTIDIIKE